jgi:hypothetical protein
MSNRGPYIAVGVLIGIIAVVLLPTWLGWLIFAVLVGIPVVAYLSLDRSQRRRIRNMRNRRLP